MTTAPPAAVQPPSHRVGSLDADRMLVTAADQPPRPARRWSVADILLLLVLLVLVVKINWDVSLVREPQMDDESYYMHWGWKLGDLGLPPAKYNPLYILWYAPLTHLPLERITAYFLNWGILAFLLSASLYVLMRSLGAARFVALAAAVLVLVMQGVEEPPYPMHLATAVLLAGTALATRLRTWVGSGAVLGVALLLAAYIRPEYATAFLLFAGVGLAAVAWGLVRRPALRLRLLSVLGLLAVATAGLGAAFGNPLAGGRAFLAFGQHYSLNRCSVCGLKIDPWTNWAAITQKDFGDAQTVGQALRNNPAAFLWHLHTNLNWLSIRARVMTRPDLDIRPDVVRWFRLLVLAPALVLGGLGVCWRFLRRGAAEADDRNLRVAVVMGLFLLVPLLPSVLLIFPRFHYMLPGMVFVIALAGVGLSRLPRLAPCWERLDSGLMLILVVAALAAVIPNRAHGWDVQRLISRREATAPPVLEVQETVKFLQGLRIHGRVVTLEPDFSRAFYAGLDFGMITTDEKNCDFWQFIRARNIGLIVLNDRLIWDTRLASDPEFKQLVSGENTGPFHVFAVPSTRVRVAVRRDLLGEVH